MPDIDELIAEVLRLDAEGTPGPWDSEKWIDAGDTTAYGVGRRDEPRPVVWSEHPGWDAATCDADEALIGYYRTAAPVLAREVQRLQAEVQPRIDRSIAFQDAMEEAEAERDEARAEVERLREMRQRGCDCNDEDACRFARERDEARAEVTRLQAEVERLQAAAYRAGQEAMRERAAAVCSARYVEHEKRLWNGPPAKRITDRVGGMTDEAEQCAAAIRALEVE